MNLAKLYISLGNYLDPLPNQIKDIILDFLRKNIWEYVDESRVQWFIYDMKTDWYFQSLDAIDKFFYDLGESVVSFQWHQRCMVDMFNDYKKDVLCLHLGSRKVWCKVSKLDEKRVNDFLIDRCYDFVELLDIKCYTTRKRRFAAK